MAEENKTGSLVDSLNQYLGMYEKPKEKLEKKPKEFKEQKNLDKSINIDMKEFEKKYNAIALNENKIICDNILASFFSLNDEKFLACMNRILNWGFETCFKEFILNYYLYIKKSNKRRHFIILHMDSIVSMLKDQVELDLMESLKNFNFTNPRHELNVKFMKADLANREKQTLEMPIKNFDEFAPPSEEKREILSTSECKNLRIAILNRLKYENPKLEAYI